MNTKFVGGSNNEAGAASLAKRDTFQPSFDDSGHMCQQAILQHVYM
jgi:hypothetical protein